MEIISFVFHSWIINDFFNKPYLHAQIAVGFELVMCIYLLSSV